MGLLMADLAAETRREAVPRSVPESCSPRSSDGRSANSTNPYRYLGEEGGGSG